MIALRPLMSLTIDLFRCPPQHYNGCQALVPAGVLPNDTAHGGYVQYAGGDFVHTSYAILGGGPRTPLSDGPPLDLFTTHNEWFWPHDDPTVYALHTTPAAAATASLVHCRRHRRASMAVDSELAQHTATVNYVGPMPRWWTTSPRK